MERDERHQRLTLESYLKAYFHKNQGVRLGETTVISQKVHSNDPATPGIIKIYTDQDAGQVYMKTEDENRVLHMDVFHEPASLDPVYVARRIWAGLDNYFQQLRDEKRTELTKEACVELARGVAQKIILQTGGGKGNVFELASRKGELIPEKKRIPRNHVHVLADIEPENYDVLIFMVDAIETAIQSQGFEIRRVDKISHCKTPTQVNPGFGIGITLPGFKAPEVKRQVAMQNRLQIVLDLAAAFGSVEEAAKFIESLTHTGNMFLSNFAKKHGDGDLKQTLLDLANKNLVQKGKFFTTLTDAGKDLRDFIRLHQKELEAQVRKSIRRYKIVRHNYQSYQNSQLKSRKNRLTDRKKVVGINDHAWLGDIAIPETIVRATARSYLAGVRPMRLKKEDIHLYGQKSFAPIDTLISIDCSGSMVGDKIRAVSYLAEHFLLTSREKVSVVTFQETSSRVVTPFTKSYQKLQDGLRSIRPEGMTPLAKGVVESVELIKKKRARNPLMVLITDGIPNFPLWTNDAQADALKAAKMIADAKIRLVCIGVIPNEAFMKELARIGQGNLYIVDELDKNSLLDVVTQEWSRYKFTK
jgi:magnesium chelatase subunit D